MEKSDSESVNSSASVTGPLLMVTGAGVGAPIENFLLVVLC